MKAKIVSYCITILLLMHSQLLWAEKFNYPEGVAEIRILIDGSNTLQQKDPQNLRNAILTQLLALLPKDGLASIWLFANNTKTLVAPGKVDEHWLQRAANLPKDFNAGHEQQNLAQALDEITSSWTEPIVASRKIILITDGFGKMAEDPIETAELKAHLVDTVIPNLKRNNIKLHILSISDYVNDVFLGELATATNGSYQHIENAKNLMWLLFKIFGKAPNISAAQLETMSSKMVPVAEQHFMVEQQTDELHLFIVKENATAMLAITLPNGKVMDKNSVLKKVHWRSIGNKEYITIEDAMAGKWTIVGNLHKDLGFLVFNNIELELSPLANDMFVGESIMLNLLLSNNGKLIDDPGFLKAIDFNVTVTPSIARIEPYIFPNTATSGVYTVQLGPFQQAFKEKLFVTTEVVAPTFKRHKQQILQIMPVPIDVRTVTSFSETGQQIIKLITNVDQKLLDPKNLNVQLKVLDPNNEQDQIYNMPKQADGWEYTLLPDASIKEYKVIVQVYGETTLGRYVELATDPIIVVVPAVSIAENTKIPMPRAEVAADQAADPNSAQIQEQSFSWFWLILLLANLGLCAGVFVIVRKVRAKQQNALAVVMAGFAGETK